ncbi:MAG: HEXXH motif-containing putative peptide modification protein [Amoebophilaceae bacterium]|jgi:uncharacterized protein YfbU (UPF0304 family)|nr:HEXXH motif-containing putative peptide modification protein [Amoebophilaceae bacterium]
MKYHFLPDPKTLAAIVDTFKRKLQASYKKLLTTIYKETGHQQSQTILEKIVALPKENFSSILTFYYHHTVRGINAGEHIPKLLSDLDLVLTFVKEKHHNSSFVVYETMPDTISHTILKTMGHSITDYNISLRGLSKTEEIQAKQCLEQGTKYLWHSCPKMLENMRELVHQIFFVGSDCPQRHCVFSLTSAVTQGIVFINGAYSPSWVFLLDKYVHEAAHAYLFLINQEELLVLNDPKELYPSPLRQDKRPMEGVYHALFVLMRLLYAFSAIREKQELMESDSKEIITLMSMYSAGLERSYTTVMREGKLTPIARLLLEDGYDAVYRSQHKLCPIRKNATISNPKGT